MDSDHYCGQTNDGLTFCDVIVRANILPELVIVFVKMTVTALTTVIMISDNFDHDLFVIQHKLSSKLLKNLE